MLEFQPPANESSQVKGLHHDPTNNTLTVLFAGGAQYAYANVPVDIFEGLHHAESPGKYLHSVIKSNPTAFPHTKLPQEESGDQ